MKHFENEMIRLTKCTDEEDLKSSEEGGILIKYKDIEFIFFPTMVIKDPTGLVVFGFKFNHKEKLLLYYQLSNSDTSELLKALIFLAKVRGYQLRDIYEYLPEIYKTSLKIAKGEIDLKDGPHPDMVIK